jgi:hypothetical protein
MVPRKEVNLLVTRKMSKDNTFFTHKVSVVVTQCLVNEIYDHPGQIHIPLTILFIYKFSFPLSCDWLSSSTWHSIYWSQRSLLYWILKCCSVKRRQIKRRSSSMLQHRNSTNVFFPRHLLNSTPALSSIHTELLVLGTFSCRLLSCKKTLSANGKLASCSI